MLSAQAAWIHHLPGRLLAAGSCWRCEMRGFSGPDMVFRGRWLHTAHQKPRRAEEHHLRSRTLTFFVQIQNHHRTGRTPRPPDEATFHAPHNMSSLGRPCNPRPGLSSTGFSSPRPGWMLAHGIPAPTVPSPLRRWLIFCQNHRTRQISPQKPTVCVSTGRLPHLTRARPCLSD